MKIARAKVYSIGTLMLLGTFAAACKTAGTSSATKDLPTAGIGQMTLQQWVDACQKELANPQTGAKSRADLIKLANTTDCAAAYPVIKGIFDHYSAGS